MTGPISKLIPSAALAATIVLGAFAAAPAAAGGDIYYGDREFRGGLTVGPEFVGQRRVHRGDRRFRRPGARRNRCRPVRALRKARALGLRRAYVYRYGRRGVAVRGRGWGKPLTVRFGRGRGCPVRSVRTR